MKKTMISISAALILLLNVVSFLYAQETAVPAADKVKLSVEQEKKIQPLAGLPLPDAFHRLKDPEFFIDEALLTRAVMTAFTGRETEAMSLAMNSLRLPRIGFIDGRQINRSDDFYLAGKIFQCFPGHAVKILEKEYQTADAVLKSGIIQTLGALEGEEAARQMLIAALDDTSFCDDEGAEGEEFLPMRICDTAYNQLVLRYRVKEVLRTIGPIHRIEVRDYHIGILKNKLADAD